MIRHKMKRIQSKLPKIRTYDVCKTSLSCFDDKRYILDNGINSLAYFVKIQEVNKVNKTNEINKIDKINEKLCKVDKVNKIPKIDKIK